LLEAGNARRIVAGAPEKARPMTLHHLLVSQGTLMLRYLRASGEHHDYRPSALTPDRP
jgi:hypothetical protein